MTIGDNIRECVNQLRNSEIRITNTWVVYHTYAMEDTRNRSYELWEEVARFLDTYGARAKWSQLYSPAKDWCRAVRADLGLEEVG